MKLYLSSLVIGDHPERLRSMAGDGASMVIITNALDFIPLEAQIKYARNQFDAATYFSGHGFIPSLIDLRFYFGRAIALQELLSRYRVIWALGGNAFLLRRAMRESGLDAFLPDLLNREGIIYGGWSAGSCVAGASLRGLNLMDDPSVEALGYMPRQVVWEGLNLLPFTIVPHFDSDNPEAPAALKTVEYLKQHALPFQTLRDGDVLVLDEEKPELLPKL